VSYTKNILAGKPPNLVLNMPMFAEMKSGWSLPAPEVPKLAGLGAGNGH
jgi:hypothetical protein